MNLDMLQWFTLVSFIVFLIPSIYLSVVSKPEARWIYINLSLGWIGGIVFYVSRLVFGVLVHEWSATLRLFQSICFGLWVFIGAAERVCVDYVLCKKFKTRIINPWMKHLK